MGRMLAGADLQRGGKDRNGNWNKEKTHCVHGHEYTPENTMLRGNGKRVCRICDRERVRSYRRRNAPVRAEKVPPRDVNAYQRDRYENDPDWRQRRCRSAGRPCRRHRL